MGFFYQALKKATGVATDAPEDSVQQPTEARFERHSTAAVLDAPPSQARIRRRLDLKFPLESLVAFLSAPVEDQNIVAMEQCRILRARIWEALRSKSMKSLLVTSAM